MYKFIASCNSNPCRNNLVWRKHFVIRSYSYIFQKILDWLFIIIIHIYVQFIRSCSTSYKVEWIVNTLRNICFKTSQNKLSLSRVVIENINFVLLQKFLKMLRRVFWVVFFLPTLIRLHISNLFFTNNLFTLRLGSTAVFIFTFLDKLNHKKILIRVNFRK